MMQKKEFLKMWHELAIHLFDIAYDIAERIKRIDFEKLQHYDFQLREDMRVEEVKDICWEMAKIAAFWAYLERHDEWRERLRQDRDKWLKLMKFLHDYEWEMKCGMVEDLCEDIEYLDMRGVKPEALTIRALIASLEEEVKKEEEEEKAKKEEAEEEVEVDDEFPF